MSTQIEPVLVVGGATLFVLAIWWFARWDLRRAWDRRTPDEDED